MTETEKKKPKMNFRADGIKLAIWEHTQTNADGQTIVNNSVTIQRSYKDKEGNWQNTNSFRKEDLPKVKLLLHKAFCFLVSDTI